VYTSRGVMRRWRISRRCAMMGGIVLCLNAGVATSSPKREQSVQTDKMVASMATFLRRGTSAPHNSQITNLARKD